MTLVGLSSGHGHLGMTDVEPAVMSEGARLKACTLWLDASSLAKFPDLIVVEDAGAYKEAQPSGLSKENRPPRPGTTSSVSWVCFQYSN